MEHPQIAAKATQAEFESVWKTTPSNSHTALQPQDGRDQEDALAQVRDGRALQDHRRLRGGHQGGCRQG